MNARPWPATLWRFSRASDSRSLITDAGVHSSGLTANFHLPVAIQPESLKRALNSLLPRDIRIMECELMDKSFNARFGAVSKTYVYRIFTGSVQSPFSQRFALHMPFPLDRPAMRRAARHFVGQKDFSSFTSDEPGKKDCAKWTSSRCRSRARRSFSPSAAKASCATWCATWWAR